MDNIYDVIRALVSRSGLSEPERAEAHQVIDEHTRPAPAAAAPAKSTSKAREAKSDG